MMLQLALPHSRANALHWVADIVLREMLGVEVEVVEEHRRDIVLRHQHRSLTMPSLFPDLQGERSRWASQVPEPPLAEWDTAAFPDAMVEEPLPVLFGRPGFETAEDNLRCEVDILGTIFFMMSRFEEVALPARDSRDRFPGSASLAWRAGTLYRPVVDEYVAVLWAMMTRLWPGLERRQRQGRIKVSCDVDAPFDPVGTHPKRLARAVAADLVKRRDPALALRRARNFHAHRSGDYRFDPYHTFDWYAGLCERHGHGAAFYFIADHSAGDIDGDYSIDEPRVIDLIRKLSERGHEIGMHGSYNTYKDLGQLLRERQRLTSACERAGLIVPPAGNRQHFLRWDTVETPDHLDSVGFEYDTTGSFADRPGFRYGTAHPFPMWSWQSLAPLRLRQAPLVVMEASVMSESYLGMGCTPEAFDLMMKLKDRAFKYGGDYTLLWHNSSLLTAAERDLFAQVLA